MCLKKYLKKFLGAGLLATTMGISLLGCGNSNSETIKIATKPMTEQFLLGEMLGLLIEDSTDFDVEITKGVGGGYKQYTSSNDKG